MIEFFQTHIPFWTASSSPDVIEIIGFFITQALGAVFLLCYAYQFFYLVVALIRRPKVYPPSPFTKRYAVVIAARNEENVLPALLDSIRAQTYPADLIDILVVADNCTDGTAAVARAAGAFVVERFDKERVGKGYALCYLFERLAAERGLDAYDAYFVFDADNVLKSDYIEQMHNAYCAGNRVITSYRNSKNYGANWISAGYALWFMREARHLNNARSLLGSSAVVAGTGFMIDREILIHNGGWKHFLLTEDIEFTADLILQGERVGYCHAAEFFDEQPEGFGQSWRQRKRWAKGLFQVILHYGAKLLARMFGRGKKGKGNRWSCFDMLVSMMPAFLLSVLQLFCIVALFLLHLIVERSVSKMLLSCFIEFWIFGYAIFFVVGVFALAAEWRRIRCGKVRAVLLLFTFPFFMLTYLPLSISALCTRVEWKPIRHKYAVSEREIGARKK